MAWPTRAAKARRWGSNQNIMMDEKMIESFGALSLAGAARRFVFSNLDALKTHLKIIFPAVLLLELVNKFGVSYGADWIQYVTLVPLVYLYACFALSWHRVSLMGPDGAACVDFLSPKKEDQGFIGFFIGVLFAPMLLGVVTGVAYGLAKNTGSQAAMGLVVLLMLPVSIYFLIQLLRFSFVLPARSMNVKLSWNEARRVSRGLIAKLIGAGILVGLAFLAAITLYALIVGLIVGVQTQGGEPGPAISGIITFIFGIPVQAAAFILMAINITMLSKAYQYGMQNNV